MGEHTALTLKCDLTQDTPQQVIETLRYMTNPGNIADHPDHPLYDSTPLSIFGYAPIPFDNHPDHPLFETELWEVVLQSAGGLVWDSNSTLEYHSETRTYSLSVRTSLKDPEQQIPLFLHWLAPFSQTQGFVGHVRPEYDPLPSRILFEDGHAFLVEPVENRAGLAEADLEANLDQIQNSLKSMVSQMRASNPEMADFMEEQLAKVKEMNFDSYSPASYQPDSSKNSAGFEEIEPDLVLQSGPSLQELAAALSASAGRPVPVIQPDVNTLAFSPDSKLVASAGEDGLIRLWQLEEDRASGELTEHKRGLLQGHTTRVQTLDFSTGGESLLLASADWAYSIWLWQVRSAEASGEVIRAMTDPATHGQNGVINAVRFVPGTGGRLLVTTFGDSFTIWDTQTGQPVKKIQEELIRATCLALSPDGKLVAVPYWTGDIGLWEVASGKRVALLSEGDRLGYGRLCFSPDGKYLAAASYAAGVKTWQVESGKALTPVGLPHTPAYGLAFHPGDIPLLALACRGRRGDDTIQLWNSESRELAGLLAAPEEATGTVTDVAISPDGRLIGASFRGALAVWKLATLNLF